MGAIPMEFLLALALSLSTIGPAWSQLVITRAGSQPSSAGPAAYFTGSARVDPLFAPKDDALRTAGAYVTFEPGARSAWHTHPAGQLLIVTSGIGRVQAWGGPIEEIRPGDVIWTPPGQKHWHGASPTSPMTHISLLESRDGKNVEWMEKVSDEQYGKFGGIVMNAPPSQGQKLFGDIAPKFAELTDNVLFGDIWARPELSRRDRSLITVSALIAMNRPDQLRAHLAIARDNGLKEDELIEAITHLGFYAGWPSAVTAISVAREVFQKKQP
jgi:4-carboxymuconolactone decarboxylase